jgi:hypothetical protein
MRKKCGLGMRHAKRSAASIGDNEGQGKLKKPIMPDLHGNITDHK